MASPGYTNKVHRTIKKMRVLEASIVDILEKVECAHDSQRELNRTCFVDLLRESRQQCDSLKSLARYSTDLE
jgi:hypothetical protein